MIDVDAIAKECEQMIGDGLDFIAPKSCNNARQIAELVVMLRDAQKDAERYRWLRSCKAEKTERLINGDCIVGLSVLDKSIDRMMKCEQ